MENYQKIFLVISEDGGDIDDIEAVFDSREKAEAFNKRYKTNSNYEIMERAFDPHYEIDHTKDPYRVTVHHNSEKAIWIAPHHRFDDIQKAKDEQYDIDSTPYTNYEAPIFRILLFAESEEAALKRALEIRDRVVASAEWKQALEQYKTAKAKQPAVMRHRSKREKELEKWLLTSITIIFFLILLVSTILNRN